MAANWCNILWHSLDSSPYRQKHYKQGFVQKPNYSTLLTLMSFFFSSNIFFLNSSSLSTNRKQTVYTTGWTPTALSIHKVKMNVLFVFFFLPACCVPDISPPLNACGERCASVVWWLAQGSRPLVGLCCRPTSYTSYNRLLSSSLWDRKSPRLNSSHL